MRPTSALAAQTTSTNLIWQTVASMRREPARVAHDIPTTCHPIAGTIATLDVVRGTLWPFLAQALGIPTRGGIPCVRTTPPASSITCVANLLPLETPQPHSCTLLPSHRHHTSALRKSQQALPSTRHFRIVLRALLPRRTSAILRCALIVSPGKRRKKTRPSMR